jgi:hypothetical protein
VRDVDPQLMRLREVEAKILLLAVGLEAAEELVQALDRSDKLRPVHEEHRRAILDGLEVLRQHREVILRLIQRVSANDSRSDL